MKRYACFILLGILLSSCISKKEENQNIHKKNIELFIEDCVASVPNVNNNDIARSILADTIKTRLQSHSGDTLAILSDLPFKYEMSLEYENGENAGKYVVKFSPSSLEYSTPKSDAFGITLQVLTIMEKHDAVKLIDKGKYLLQGKFIDFANNTAETGFVLPSGRCFIDYPSVSTSELGKKIDVNLGTLILEDIVLKEMK